MRFAALSLAVAGLIAAAQPARADLMRAWSPRLIAAEAQAVVVGEVVSDSVVGPVPAEPSGWQPPLLVKCAGLRVLRSWGKGAPILGELLPLTYRAYDGSYASRVIGWRVDYPAFTPGEVCAVPLRRLPPPTRFGWELLEAEQRGLVLPAVPRPLAGAPRGSLPEFLAAELAGSLAYGKFHARNQALNWLSSHGAGRRHELSLIPVVQRVAERVPLPGRDWLEIGAAAYTQLWAQPPLTISRLLAAPPGDADPMVALARRALQRVPGTGVEQQVLSVLVDHPAADPYQHRLGYLLQCNWSAATRALVIRRLRADAPGLFQATWLLTRVQQAQVRPALLAAACRALRRPQAPPADLARARSLVQREGDDRAFELLLREAKTAQRTDPARFFTLAPPWQYDAGPRALRLLSLPLGDRRVLLDLGLDDGEQYRQVLVSLGWPPGMARRMRFCDKAADNLQKLVNQDFGFRSGDPVAERDVAVKRAQAWLAKQGIKG